MLKAKVKVAFPGCPDGEVITRTIEVGETISGDLAQVAVAEKLATRVREKSATGDKKDA